MAQLTGDGPLGLRRTTAKRKGKKCKYQGLTRMALMTRMALKWRLRTDTNGAYLSGVMPGLPNFSTAGSAGEFFNIGYGIGSSGSTPLEDLNKATDNLIDAICP
jgi:hypothetical protein